MSFYNKNATSILKTFYDMSIKQNTMELQLSAIAIKPNFSDLSVDEINLCLEYLLSSGYIESGVSNMIKPVFFNLTADGADFIENLAN